MSCQSLADRCGFRVWRHNQPVESMRAPARRSGVSVAAAGVAAGGFAAQSRSDFNPASLSVSGRQGSSGRIWRAPFAQQFQSGQPLLQRSLGERLDDGFRRSGRVRQQPSNGRLTQRRIALAEPGDQLRQRLRNRRAVGDQFFGRNAAGRRVMFAQPFKQPIGRAKPIDRCNQSATR